jgi:hypothetical protein
MRADDTGIFQGICYIPTEPSGNLLLVELIDRRLYIVRNDVVWKDKSWNQAEASLAMAAFNKLKQSIVIKRFEFTERRTTTLR